MYSSAMVDLETLSTANNAVIASVSIVLFDVDGEDDYEAILEDKSRWLLVRPELEEQQAVGLHIDASTIVWWMEEPGRLAQVETFLGAKSSSSTVTDAINYFLHVNDRADRAQDRRTKLWGNGATFDNVILRNYFKAFGAELPSPFYNDADLRTLEYLARTVAPIEAARIKAMKPHVAHSALHDAINQVIQAQQYYQVLTQYERIGG